MTTTWGLSTLDGHSHAVDECAEHPTDGYVARCGHRLSTMTLLSERPHHALCEECAAHQYSRAVLAHRDRDQAEQRRG